VKTKKIWRPADVLRGLLFFWRKKRKEKDLSQRKRRGETEGAEKRGKRRFLAALGMTVLCLR
jgi:hypothetical protein